MITFNTKCVVVKAPECLSGLIGQGCTASSEQGARGTGTQAFKLDSGGAIYANADSGFEVNPK